MRRLSLSDPALRARWPLALLLLSLALTGVAGGTALRMARSNSAAARAVQRDYAEFAAWAFAQHLADALRAAAQEAIGAVNMGDALHVAPTVPTASDLPHYLQWDPKCSCHRAIYGPNPETFVAFDIQKDWLQVAINTHPRPSEGWEVDRPLPMPAPEGLFTGYSSADRERVLQDIKREAHTHPDREHGYTFVLLPLDMGPRVVAFTLMPTVRGDTLVYGVQYTRQEIARIITWVARGAKLLPPSISGGRSNHDLVEVAVTDPAGRTLFADGAPAASPLGRYVDLPVRFASLRVTAAIRADQSSSMLVGGLPVSRLPFLLVLLGLAVALTVVAVTQLRRETQLARLRSEWIASVSHELRTPLSQIRLYLDTIRLGRVEGAERQRWALQQVDRETSRLSHLVEKVLTFSRSGQARGPSPEPVDVAAEARAIVEEFRPLAAARGVAIDAEAHEASSVRLRPDALRHVLLNLLDNAVKYGPPGQSIRVSVARVDDEVQLSVSDHGPGIPESERETIWQPFVRGNHGMSQGGSGIGLAIVRDMAQQHGGRAWVEAAPGGGARFVVAFPWEAEA